MEPPSSRNITVINESERIVRKLPLVRAIDGALSSHGHSGASVCLLLTSDEKVRELNRRFRGIDESTDVLTFPSGAFAGDQLGDIAISVPYAERQARVRKVSLSQELGFLAIHGALHLVGFDDETEPERAAMVSEMNAVAIETGFKPDSNWASILHGEAM